MRQIKRFIYVWKDIIKVGLRDGFAYYSGGLGSSLLMDFVYKTINLWIKKRQGLTFYHAFSPIDRSEPAGLGLTSISIPLWNCKQIILLTHHTQTKKLHNLYGLQVLENLAAILILISACIPLPQPHFAI
jgi:hypothetical protein